MLCTFRWAAFKFQIKFRPEYLIRVRALRKQNRHLLFCKLIHNTKSCILLFPDTFNELQHTRFAQPKFLVFVVLKVPTQYTD